MLVGGKVPDVALLNQGFYVMPTVLVKWIRIRLLDGKKSSGRLGMEDYTNMKLFVIKK